MKNEITYTEHNGLYYPNLALPEQTSYPLGKYANLRLDFIKATVAERTLLLLNSYQCIACSNNTYYENIKSS